MQLDSFSLIGWNLSLKLRIWLTICSESLKHTFSSCKDFIENICNFIFKFEIFSWYCERKIDFEVRAYSPRETAEKSIHEPEWIYLDGRPVQKISKCHFFQDIKNSFHWITDIGPEPLHFFFFKKYLNAMSWFIEKLWPTK